MMFLLPVELKRRVPSAGIPAANLWLMAANVIVFMLGLSWPVGYRTSLASVLLYGFSHVNLWHLVLNLWLLWVFGNPVNRRLGNGYYLMAYLGAIVGIGLVARWGCVGAAVGASGGIFAVMTIAMLLMPAARLEVAYLVSFPLSALLGLLVRPRRFWLEWFLRWGTWELSMVWCLVLIPLLLLLELFWGRTIAGGWNWSAAAHLLGVLGGVAIVIMLPTGITMPGRWARGTG